MDDILIDFDNKYYDKVKDSINKNISKFIDDSMGDLYKTIIEILKEKKQKKYTKEDSDEYIH